MHAYTITHKLRQSLGTVLFSCSSSRLLDVFALILSNILSFRDSGRIFVDSSDYEFPMERATSRNFGSRTPMTATSAAPALPTRTTTQREAYSRVPCRYFNSQKGYFILSSTSILMRFSCYKGKECRFAHDIASQDAVSNTSTDMPDQLSSPHSETPSSSPADPPTVPTHVCGICFEIPKKYGLLANCSHVFCLCLSPPSNHIDV